MSELSAAMTSGKSPTEMLDVRTIEVAAPPSYGPAEVRALRHRLRVSQPVFAQLVGASTILVQSWEQGTREPNPMARRLLQYLEVEPEIALLPQSLHARKRGA